MLLRYSVSDMVVDVRGVVSSDARKTFTQLSEISDH